MTEEPQDGEHGATATEYAVLVGFIALVIVIGVTAFGSALEAYYQGAVATVKTALGLP